MQIVKKENFHGTIRQFVDTLYNDSNEYFETQVSHELQQKIMQLLVIVLYFFQHTYRKVSVLESYVKNKLFNKCAYVEVNKLFLLKLLFPNGRTLCIYEKT